MVTLKRITEPPRLGEGEPLSTTNDSEQFIKQTSKIEVDSLKVGRYTVQCCTASHKRVADGVFFIQGNTFVNQYLIIKDLGTGSFGRVKLCLNVDDNCLYALKVVSKKQLRRRLLAGKRSRAVVAEEDLLREINVMQRLEHPNIVHLFEVSSPAVSFECSCGRCMGRSSMIRQKTS